MTDKQIKPDRITRPIQLLAAWLSGLVIIEAAFLAGASQINVPSWAPGLLVIAAIINVPLFLVAIFVLQTRFRPEMQEDEYYAKYLGEKQRRVEEAARELEDGVERDITLAQMLADETALYVDGIISKLALEEPEANRLRRALREEVRAKQAQFSHKLDRELLQSVVLSSSAPADTKDDFLRNIAMWRYERMVPTDTETVQADMSSIDLSSSIERICELLKSRAEQDRKVIDWSVAKDAEKVLATRGILETALMETSKTLDAPGRESAILPMSSYNRG